LPRTVTTLLALQGVDVASAERLLHRLEGVGVAHGSLGLLLGRFDVVVLKDRGEPALVWRAAPGREGLGEVLDHLLQRSREDWEQDLCRRGPGVTEPVNDTWRDVHPGPGARPHRPPADQDLQLAFKNVDALMPLTVEMRWRPGRAGGELDLEEGERFLDRSALELDGHPYGTEGK
jgi:hypothetical protein